MTHSRTQTQSTFISCPWRRLITWDCLPQIVLLVGFVLSSVHPPTCGPSVTPLCAFLFFLLLLNHYSYLHCRYSSQDRDIKKTTVAPFSRHPPPKRKLELVEKLKPKDGQILCLALGRRHSSHVGTGLNTKKSQPRTKDWFPVGQPTSHYPLPSPIATGGASSLISS